MAKVGEGDQRWIVDDRKDGRNVGAWHWEEKDLSDATHDALKAAFKGLSMLCENDDGVSLTYREVSDVSGDVTVAQRKGKIMCYFDLKVTIRYSGTMDGAKVEGKLTMPEVDHDCVGDDYDIQVDSTENNAASNKAATWVKKHGRPQVRATIAAYFAEVYAKYNVGKMIQKGGGGSTGSPTGAAPAAAKPTTTAAPANPTPTTTTTTSSGAGKGRIEWKMEWRAPLEDLWNTLMQSERVSVYTRAPAKIEPRANGTFELLDGLISGYFVDVVHPEKVSMQWRLSSWPTGTFSTVVMTFHKVERDVTRLEFAQVGIPEGDEERVKSGWHGNFWEPIKGMTGYRLEFKD